jgi:hypothetical protein
LAFGITNAKYIEDAAPMEESDSGPDVDADAEE